MNQNLTEVIVVLDESTSMGPVAQQTMSGYNEFVKSQAAQPGECKITLQKFNSVVPPPTLSGVDARFVAPLNSYSYSPRGMTALYDAVGKTIQAVGDRLANTSEHLRPGKVIFVIQTDGEENSSREYSAELVKSMIEHQKSKYSWDFVFIGSAKDIDVAKTASMLGIGMGSTLAYNMLNSSDVAFASVSNYVTTSRSVGSAAFSQTDRDNAVGVADTTTTVTP
jgi:hypothetical protein